MDELQEIRRRKAEAYKGTQREKAMPSEGKASGKEPDRQSWFAYALLFLGGPFGLHHIYLRRPLQSLVWGCTPFCGFFFNLGVFRDLFRIPEYVEMVNSPPGYIENLEGQMRYRQYPPYAPTRFIAAWMNGAWWGTVGQSVCPFGSPPLVWAIMGGFYMALGVWLVGMSCSHQVVSFVPTLVAGIVCPLLSALGETSIIRINISQSFYPIIVAFVAWRTRQWKAESRKVRIGTWKVVSLGLLFWFTAIGGFIEHAAITFRPSADSQPSAVRLKDCLGNILRGFDAADFFKDTYEKEFGEGRDENRDWQHRWDEFISSLDVQGERRALKLLGMEDFIGKTYTENDVKKHYKTMAKKHHPDRVIQQGSEARRAAEIKMQEINEAQESLLQIMKGKENQERERQAR